MCKTGKHCLSSRAVISLCTSFLPFTHGGASGQGPTCQGRRHGRYWFDPWVRKIPWRRAWQPTPVLAWRIPWTEEPGSPWGRKESDMTEVTKHACTYKITTILVLVGVGIQMLGPYQLFIYWNKSLALSPLTVAPAPPWVPSSLLVYLQDSAKTELLPVSQGACETLLTSGWPGSVWYQFIWMNVSVAQSCPTLCNAMDCSPPGSSVHRILQASILEWAVISFSGESSWPRDRTPVSCIVGRFFTI